MNTEIRPIEKKAKTKQVEASPPVQEPVSQEQRVKEIAHKNDTSKAIFLELAVRNRLSRKTDLARFEIQLLRDGIPVIHDDFVKTFEDLAKENIGTIIQPRSKTANPEFNWNLSMLKVGEMAEFPQDILQSKRSLKEKKLKELRERVVTKPKKTRKRKYKTSGKYTKNKDFNRSEFMKAFWAKRRKNVKPHKVKKDKVVTLLQRVLKELQKSA